MEPWLRKLVARFQNYPKIKLKVVIKVMIRRFQNQDAQTVSKLVAKTLLTTNSKDYSKAYLTKVIAERDANFFIENSQYTHMYVVSVHHQIVGCGAIGPFWGKEDESSLFNMFVLPTYQGLGIGRKLIQTLEKDVYFKRAKRIEIPASITGLGFYQKMGYKFKNGQDKVDDEGLYRLEKFNSPF